MHVEELARRAGLSVETARLFCSALASDREAYLAFAHRVHLEYATGRQANDEGTDVIDPPPIRVKLLQDYVDLKAGAVIEKPYREAVWLLNKKLATLPE